MLYVEAICPSIDPTQGPRIIAEEVLKSSLQYENVNIHLLGVYLGTVMSKERQTREGTQGLVPIRKAVGRQGRKPTVHGQELGGPKRREKVIDNNIMTGLVV